MPYSMDNHLLDSIEKFDLNTVTLADIRWRYELGKRRMEKLEEQKRLAEQQRKELERALGIYDGDDEPELPTGEDATVEDAAEEAPSESEKEETISEKNADSEKDIHSDSDENK